MSRDSLVNLFMSSVSVVTNAVQLLSIGLMMIALLMVYVAVAIFCLPTKFISMRKARIQRRATEDADQ